MRIWLIALLAAILAPALLIAQSQSAPDARVLDVRFGGAGDLTRVVIESDKPLKYSYFLLEAGARRIVIDLPRVRWSINGLTTESGAGEASGLVSGYRYAHNTATTSRLVMDLAVPALVRGDQILPPAKDAPRYRLVFDLEKAPAEAFSRQAARDQASPRAVAERVAPKPLIVIDPGHGGKDPGAISPQGMYEKDVTLGVALALRDELLKSGRYEVALTRVTDTFLDLDERVTRARNLGANLFISLHADAGPRPETRGASVYTLSPEGERRAEAARQKNDWVLAVEADAARSPEVNQILADLVQRETKNQSARFAQMLVPALAEAGWPALGNPHRRKGFYVLLSPDVPAVLLEMGFLTNASDAAMLASEKQRRNLVKAVAGAIDTFFTSQTSLVAAR